MNSRIEPMVIARYVACYAIWLALTALVGYVVLQTVGTLLEVSLALRFNPWQARAVRQLSLPILGLIWLVLMLWMESYFRTAVPKRRLIARSLRVLLPALGALALLRLVEYLI